ncbi:MAG: ROK family transcriptional regulator [Clostridia bacterium]|nr:ROK family transcriptional regulator [Clostridia bacterium]
MEMSGRVDWLMPVQTGNQGFVKGLNKAIVLNAIWNQPDICRAEISRLSGLNRATVSSLVEELIADGYVVENGMGESALGRKPVMLQANPNACLMVGVDLGVDYAKLAMADFTMKVLATETLPIGEDPRHEDVVSGINACIRQFVERAPATVRGLAGIGLGVPGLVDSDRGVLAFAPNLHWENVPLRELVQSQFHVPVFVDNEANAGAIGEKWFGAGKGAQNMIYFSAGIGIGAGIFVNGGLLRGFRGYAGEVGHFTVIPGGLQCGCGNHGCWETVASESAAIHRVKSSIKAGRQTLLQEAISSRRSHSSGCRLTADDLLEACEKGDAVAIEALKETGRSLGTGIAGFVNAFNPELVIVGNSMGRMMGFVLEEAEREMRKHALVQLADGLQLVPAMLGADACVIGAISMVLNQILSLPNIYS